jgi:N-acetylglucosaminyl-diphospho-decaprenol L-rhamnosyltransferase
MLNPDAEISGGTFAGLVKIARDLPKAGVIGTLVRDPDGTRYPSARKIPTLSEAAGHALLGPFSQDNRFSRAYTMDGWDRTSQREVDWVSGSSMLLRREAFTAVGGFDEEFFMYAEDADLCTRMRDAGWTVVFSPEMVVVHDHGLTTRGSNQMVWEHSRSIYRYFAKHQARGWRKILLPFAKIILSVRAAIVARGLGSGTSARGS